MTAIAGRMAAALLLLAVVGCATVPDEDPILFRGKGDGWSVVVGRQSTTLRDRVGRTYWLYEGPTPTPEPIAGGIRYAANLTRTYVVAGLAEQDDLDVVVEIAAAPCGRNRPATMTLHILVEDGTAVTKTGCGTGRPPPSGLAGPAPMPPPR